MTDTQTVPPPGGKRRPGDWNCTECKMLNFAHRDKCFRCNGRKPGAHSIPGDWTCVKCTETNFRRRITCYGCGEARGEAPNNVAYEVAKPSVTRRAGDWDCRCGKMNFGTRTVCYTCGAARPPVDGAVPEEKGGGGTVCAVCLDEPLSVMFQPCGHCACCVTCASALDKCPICRGPIVNTTKIFLSGADS